MPNACQIVLKNADSIHFVLGNKGVIKSPLLVLYVPADG